MTTAVAPIDAVCEPRTGVRDPRKQPGTEFLYVDISSVDNYTKQIVEPKCLAGEEAPSRARRVIKTNDVIVSLTRPNLNAVALVPERLDNQICSTGFSVLRAKPDILPEYLFFFLTTPEFVGAVSGAVSGAMYPAITERFLRSIRLPLPPLDEQRRIVDILNHAASIRRLREQAQAKAREIIPALFLDMFGDPATNPQDLPKVSLGSVIATGPQNGLYRHKSDYGEGTPIVRINSFYSGRVTDIENIPRLRLSSKNIKKYRVNPDDILINRVNSRPYLGKSAIVPSLSEPTVFESNIMRFSVNTDLAVPAYIIAALQMDDIKDQVLSSCKDAINQSSINQTDVQNLSLLLPPVDSQSRFVERYYEIFSLIGLSTSAAERSETLLSSLISRFFSRRLLDETLAS